MTLGRWIKAIHLGGDYLRPIRNVTWSHVSVERIQRLGAYAVVLGSDESGVEHLLLTRISELGYPVGAWGLPGGGVEHGESPEAALRRELCEETGLQVADQWLIDVHDLHLVAPGRGGRIEDYHGVHLLYSVNIVQSGAVQSGLAQVRVVEPESTTDLVRWVPVRALSAADSPEPGGPLLAVVPYVLGRLDRYR